VPIGEVTESIFEVLSEQLPRVFGQVSVVVAGRLSDYEIAYSPQRKQYHSSRLLVLLNDLIAKTDYNRALGIIEHDLFLPGLNFVFGEARMNGPVCVISTARLRSNNDGVFRERLAKEAVHELGHSYGLDHCDTHSCVMFFSNSIEDTDKKSWHFCSDCRSKLEP
jgi:archaemetzincin